MYGLREAITRNPMVYGVCVSRDFTSTLIQADFFSGVSSRAIFDKVRALARAAASPDVEVYYSGRPILEGWLDLHLKQMGWLFAVSLAVLALLLHFSFHSKRGIGLPLISAMMATIWGIASLAFLHFHLSPSTILVPFLVMALGVSHSVQFVKRYYDDSVGLSDPDQVNEKVLEQLLVPAAISLFTDGVGFLSLLFIPLKLIQSMALAAGIGCFSIFLTTVFFIPAVLCYLPLPANRELQAEEKPNFLDGFLTVCASWITGRRRVIFTVFAVLGAVGLVGVCRLRVGDNQPGSPTLYPGSEYNISERIINREFGGTDPCYIMVEGLVPEAIISSEVLREMESLQYYLLKNVPEAGRAISLVDYVKGFNMVFNDGKREFYRIPELDQTVGEYLFLYSISGFPGDFDHVCSPDFNHANIKIDLKDHRTVTIERVVKTVRDWEGSGAHRTTKVRFLYPGGIIGTLGALNDTIRKSIPGSLAIVVPLTFLCAVYFLGSLYYGFLLLIPLAFSMVVTFGVMGFLGVPLTIETLPLASLGVGLGVDYGIYILGRMKDEQGSPDSLLRTLLTSGKAVFFTAFSVSAGVLVWVFSPVKMDAKLGLCLASLLLLNMISALVLLPAMFSGKKLFEKGVKREM